MMKCLLIAGEYRGFGGKDAWIIQGPNFDYHRIGARWAYAAYGSAAILTEISLDRRWYICAGELCRVA